MSNRFSDIVCLVGHAADDIDFTTDESITLLTHPQELQSRFVKVSDPDTDTDIEGSYLYYDHCQHRWVHSGIAVGCSCEQRSVVFMQNEHQRHSQADAAGAPNSRNDCSISSTRLVLLYPEKSIKFQIELCVRDGLVNSNNTVVYVSAGIMIYPVYIERKVLYFRGIQSL